jgi:hypothetical protein
MSNQTRIRRRKLDESHHKALAQGKLITADFIFWLVIPCLPINSAARRQQDGAVKAYRSDQTATTLIKKQLAELKTAISAAF